MQHDERVHYVSMEFLIGRQLANNVTKLLLNPQAEQILREIDVDRITLVEEEPDAGLGNGGPSNRSALLARLTISKRSFATTMSF